MLLFILLDQIMIVVLVEMENVEGRFVYIENIMGD